MPLKKFFDDDGNALFYVAGVEYQSGGKTLRKITRDSNGREVSDEAFPHPFEKVARSPLCFCGLRSDNPVHA